MNSSGKKIWIINQYGNLPNIGIGGRHYYLARELSVFGHKVTNVSARWSHVMRDGALSQSAPTDESVDGFRFYRINVPKYKTAHSKKRILNWFIFAWRIKSIGMHLNEYPDVIVYSSPSLIAYLSAYRLAKKYNARLIFEVRDIWPLTLIQLGGYSSRHPFIRFMQWIEDFAYKKSDHVISNLEGAVEHGKSRGLDSSKFTWVPNGYDEKELVEVEAASSDIISSIKSQDFSLTYTGGVGESNSLDTLIEAAYKLKDRLDIHYNIVGQGWLSESLKRIVKELGLTNFHFWGAIPKRQVQSVLKVSDACVICWRKSELYDYGLAANKLFDYMYASKPIINAYSGGYDIVERYRAGITVPAGDSSALSDAIVKFASLNHEDLKNMGRNGFDLVRQNHEYRQIAKVFERAIIGEKFNDRI